MRKTGLFVTAIDAPDNVRTIVGDARLSQDTAAAVAAGAGYQAPETRHLVRNS